MLPSTASSAAVAVMRMAAASLSRRAFSAQAAPASAAASGSRASWFGAVEMAPRDPILGITEKFLADKSPDKINLGVGAYRDDEGRPVVLDCVREAERRVAGKEFMEYLPIGGLRAFVDQSVRLAFGDAVADSGTVAAVQSLSGTGSCRLMAEFQRRFMPGTKALIPASTWPNHYNIWRDAGVPHDTYRYLDSSAPAPRLDFDGLVEDLRAAPDGSLVLLHAVAHNPSGCDPTEEQWRRLSKEIAAKRHFPFFDCAYQGFASGDCDRDAAALRMFVADGHAVGLAQSYAKNMGLYGQRIGAFAIVCASKDEAARVESQMKVLGSGFCFLGDEAGGGEAGGRAATGGGQHCPDCWRHRNTQHNTNTTTAQQ